MNKDDQHGSEYLQQGNRYLHCFSAHHGGIAVRSATHRDLLKIADVITISFHTHKGLWRWLEPVCRWSIYEDVRSRLQTQSEHYLCLVAISKTDNSQLTPLSKGQNDGGEICGTVEMALRSHRIYPGINPYVSNLAVHTAYRRRGVGQKLLKTCEQVAKNWGFSEIYLHVLENNHQARQLYAKVGYNLHLVDGNLWTWLFRQPRKLLLKKSL